MRKATTSGEHNSRGRRTRDSSPLRLGRPSGPRNLRDREHDVLSAQKRLPHRIVLRPAQPTLAEGLAFVRYLDRAAEGFFRFWLGRRAEELVAQAYVEPDNEYSFQNVTFAELDGRVVGRSALLHCRAVR